jgi:Kdo2-lipid IVA lauroyltransferase/acyltransferase
MGYVIRGLMGLAAAAAGWAPRGWLLALGRGLGWAWFYGVPVRRRLTLAHLRAAGAGRWSEQEVWQIARGAFVTQALNAVELLGWRRLLRVKGQVPWVRVEGEVHLEAAKAMGRGVLLVTAHLGAFDWVACQQAAAGQPLHVVSRQLSWEAMNAVWMQTRAKLGLRVLPPDAPMQPALAALKAGGVVALVLDQHSAEARAVEAPFFGIAARTSAALALLALRSRAPVVPCFTVREEGGGHVLWFEPPLPLPEQGDTRQRVVAFTQGCLRALEVAILKHPQQWLWLHRRWKDAERNPLIRG